MIIKSMSRRSNSGQLFQYVFRYVFKEAQEEELNNEERAPVTKTKREDVHQLTEAFSNGLVTFSEEKEQDIASGRNQIDSLLGASIRLGKTNPLVKDLAAREAIKGKDLTETKFRIAPGYVIAQKGAEERFFKLDTPDLPAQREDASESQEKPFIIAHNVKSRTLGGFIKEFERNESFRIHHRSNSVQLYHTVISFSDKDKEHITDTLLKDIAKQFISLRDKDCLVVGTRHSEKDHQHLHLVVSGTRLNGRSSRMSKAEFHQLKLTMDNYQRQKYPELVHSLPEHGQSKNRILSKEEAENRYTRERTTNKATLLQCLESIYAKSRSEEHFLSQLQEAGHEPYYRNGKIQGVRYLGETKYRFSKLNFDIEKLQGLEQLRKDEQELDELRSIRERKSQTREKTEERLASLEGKETSPTTERDQLEELEALRESRDSDHGRDDDPSEPERQADSEPDEEDDTDDNSRANESPAEDDTDDEDDEK